MSQREVGQADHLEDERTTTVRDRDRRQSGTPAPTQFHRRAIFFDVENTSRAQHVARVIEQLALDHLDARTNFFAIGNWAVVSDASAQLLAREGAHLIHSAPVSGVQDWSDLRIGAAAGVWLGSARAGDRIDVVSDDRAFDAVGDVAATLGVTFTRLSYRRLAGADGGSPAVALSPGRCPRRGRQRHGR